MRTNLRTKLGQRATYTATVDRFGQKNAYRGPPLKTLCLCDVTDSDGHRVADHLWFTVGLTIAKINLYSGLLVSFEARVTEYEKGYNGYREDVYKPFEIDYRLSNPTKFKIILGSKHKY